MKPLLLIPVLLPTIHAFVWRNSPSRRGLCRFLQPDEHEFSLNKNLNAQTPAAAFAPRRRETFFLQDEGLSMQDQLETFQKRFMEYREPRYFEPDQTRSSPEPPPPRTPKPTTLKRYNPPPQSDSSWNSRKSTTHGTSYQERAFLPDSPGSMPYTDVPQGPTSKRKAPKPATTNPSNNTVAMPRTPSGKDCPIPPAFTNTSLFNTPGPGPVLEDTFKSPPRQKQPSPPPAPTNNVIVIPPPPGSTVGKISTTGQPPAVPMSPPAVAKSTPSVASPATSTTPPPPVQRQTSTAPVSLEKTAPSKDPVSPVPKSAPVSSPPPSKPTVVNDTEPPRGKLDTPATMPKPTEPEPKTPATETILQQKDDKKDDIVPAKESDTVMYLGDELIMVDMEEGEEEGDAIAKVTKVAEKVKSTAVDKPVPSEKPEVANSKDDAKRIEESGSSADEAARRREYFAQRIAESRQRALLSSLALRKEKQSDEDSSTATRFNPLTVEASVTPVPNAIPQDNSVSKEEKASDAPEKDPQELL